MSLGQSPGRPKGNRTKKFVLTFMRSILWPFLSRKPPALTAINGRNIALNPEIAPITVCHGAVLCDCPPPPLVSGHPQSPPPTQEVAPSTSVFRCKFPLEKVQGILHLILCLFWRGRNSIAILNSILKKISVLIQSE